MYFVCARDVYPVETYTIVNIETRKVQRVKRKELIEMYKKCKFKNIKILDDTVYGEGYNLSNMSRHCKDGKLFVAYRLVNSYKTVAYRCISAIGNIVDIKSEEALLYFKKYKIVNGYLSYNEKYDSTDIVIYENSCGVINIINNSGYSVDDYVKLFKQYSKVGLSRETTISSIYEFGDYGEIIENKNMETGIESFISCHKRLCNILSRVNILEAKNVYNNTTINYSRVEDNFSLEQDNLWGYLVKFTFNNRVFEIVVSKYDTRLLRHIKCDRRDMYFDELLDLFCYSDVEMESNESSLLTSIEKTSGFNRIELVKLSSYLKAGSVKLTLTNGCYTSEAGINLKIRNSIKPNCGEIRTLFNIIRESKTKSIKCV